MSRSLFSPLQAGSTIGILGGGQLGRMLSNAASRLGFQCHIYCPEMASPAARVSHLETNAPYEDLDSVRDFSEKCDVVTYEFENVPAFTAKAAAIAAILRPGVKALEVSQDRWREKTFLRDIAKVPVTPFEKVDSVFDIKRGIKVFGLPCVLKTRRMGYDGKGQVIIREGDDLDTAFEKLGGKDCILEKFIPFKREVSVIAARSVTGQTTSYPLIENVHRNHILHTSTAPTEGDTGQARRHAINILGELNYFGVLAVEFFEREDGSLLVNEIAPRVHNSGHWTQNAGCIDQFELHIRAISGWPLGDIKIKHGVQMTNLIGRDVNSWDVLAAEPDTFVHFYGKKDARPGRKMGHVNRIIYVPRGLLQ